MDREWIALSDHRKRSTAILIIVAVILTVFIGRLVELQAFRASALASEAQGQRLKEIALPAERGAITDAAGNPLAVTVQAYNVTADQTLIADPVATANAMAPILSVDPAALAARLTGDRRFVYVAKDLTPETWQRISDLGLPGILKEGTSKRIYPSGSLAANIVGFVGADGKGLGGLESGMQDVLAGTDGMQTYERGQGGRAIPTAQHTKVEAVAGSTVKLTIDRDIQYAAQKAIAAKVAEARAESGTVVVMDPHTGKILALATAPTFDPNDISKSRSSDLGNRALSDVFEPGSTAKTMTMAAVIDQGAATPTTGFTIPGTLKRGDKVFHDDVAHGTWYLTLTGVLAKSSNLGTILASERIGSRTFNQYLRKFGMGQPTGLDFPGESKGTLMPYKDWSQTTFPTLVFGQGMNMNTVHAASVYATIANGGVRVTPSLIDSVTAPDGTVTPGATPEETVVVSPKTAKTVLAMLESVVSEQGTAPKARIPGYRVAGKTVTAQVAVPGGYGRDVIASFIGVAPADKPELVVAVTVVKPQVGRWGGQLAAPVFKEVMMSALKTRHVPPTGTTPPSIPLKFSKNG
ncbi:MAG: peptidoglycan D,D-transpeptidase FtsI family protein [Actinomycetes bacterium]